MHRAAALYSAVAANGVGGTLSALWDSVTQPYTSRWNSGHQAGAIGYGTAEVILTIVGTKGAGKLAKLGASVDGVAAKAVPASNKIYSARALERMAEEPGPMHNFPGSFDDEIFASGTRTVSPSYFNKAKPNLSNDSVQYRLPGEVNGRSGTFEVFTRPSQSGRTEVIMHRLFRPES